MATWGTVIDFVANPGFVAHGRPMRFGAPADPFSPIYGLPGWSDIYRAAIAVGLYGLGQSIPEMVRAITAILIKRYPISKLRALQLPDVAVILQEEVRRPEGSTTPAGPTQQPIASGETNAETCEPPDKLDTRTDKRKKPRDSRSRDFKRLRDQWREFNKSRRQCDTDRQAALEITNQDEKRAEAILRQFRRYRTRLDDGG